MPSLFLQIQTLQNVIPSKQPNFIIICQRNLIFKEPYFINHPKILFLILILDHIVQGFILILCSILIMFRFSKYSFQYWSWTTSIRGCGAVSPCLGPGSTCEEHDNTFTCYCAKVPYHQPDNFNFWYATAIINLVDPGPDREVLREGDRNGRPCCCWLHWIQPCCGKSWNFTLASFHRAAIFKLTILNANALIFLQRESNVKISCSETLLFFEKWVRSGKFL